VVPATTKGKRPRESDTGMETDDKLSKAQRKKAKKQKAADGAAVPTSVEAAVKPQPVPAKADLPTGKKDKNENEEKKEGKKKTPKGRMEGLKELPSGLKLKDVSVGTGPQARSGQTVMLRYIGKLSDGTIFDSNTSGKPVREYTSTTL
jgi:FK506-binding nuclear protein